VLSSQIYCHVLVTEGGYWIDNRIYCTSQSITIESLRTPSVLQLTIHSLTRQLQHSLDTNFFFSDSPNSEYQLNSEVYDLWSDCRGDSAVGIGCLAITRETGTLRPRACTLPSNVYSMACTSQYLYILKWVTQPFDLIQ
jgi:hypothetical protein